MEHTGTIVGVQHQPGSGLALLVLVDESERTRLVPADAGPLFRALRSAFDDEAIGREVAYSVDVRGALEGFTPIGEVAA